MNITQVYIAENDSDYDSVDVARFDNNCYWRIYYSSHTNLMTVVCMQWFDECDYLQKRFFNYPKQRYDTEEEAVNVLLTYFKPEFIDDEFRDSIDFNFSNMLKD